MMKYEGLVIKTSPNYRTAVRKGEQLDEIHCEVYDENDKDFKRCLGDFNIMRSFEFSENTVKDIESGIKAMIDSDWAYYQLEKKQPEFERTAELFHRAVNFIRVNFGEETAGQVLKNELGMTDAEIENVLTEPDAEQNEGITMQ